jgi:hypothetical protein
MYCGTSQEKVPANVFKYYFYEKWATRYDSHSYILMVDMKQTFFQSNPFVRFDTSSLRENRFRDNLAVFQESHPNLLIGRSSRHSRAIQECYGEETGRLLASRIPISAGAIIGTRNAQIVWSRRLTTQIQEAPGRLIDTRCSDGDVIHAFVNWIVYSRKERQSVDLTIYSHGEGIVNSLYGLYPAPLPSTKEKGYEKEAKSAGGNSNDLPPPLAGDLRTFWKAFSDDKYVLSWNGQRSPIVIGMEQHLPSLLQQSNRPVVDQTDQKCPWHAVAKLGLVASVSDASF